MISKGGKAGAVALRWLRHKVLYSVGFGFLILFLISLALFDYSDFGKPKADVVRIAYVAGGSARKHFLEQMALNGRKWNLNIQLVTTESTDSTLSLIDQHVVDLGLVGGAVEDRAERKVVEVSPLYMESLQLAVKPALYTAVSKDFGQLKGKSISMDGANSATSVMAGELLRFIGLADPVTGAPEYRLVNIPQSQLAAQTDAALPDAIFQIASVPSATITDLVEHHNYRLVALPFGDAFNLSKFRESDSPKAAEDAPLALNKTFVEEAMIPAYVYGVLPAVPEADIRTIAARLVLVGGEHLSNDVVKRILGLVMSPDISHIVEPQLTAKLLDSEFQFQRHPGTDAYLESLKPFNVDGAFAGYQRVVEIWGILVALYLTSTNAWKWWKGKRDHRSRESVGHFMTQVLEVENEVHGATSDEDRKALDRRLSDIKKESIGLHLESRLEDSKDLHALMVALADTRARIWGKAN